MSTIKRSPLALAILTMLIEAPMHPYRMQRLIKARGKDEVINVAQRASLYQTIQRLEREGLLVAQQRLRDDKRPERTIYRITDVGRDIALGWMRQMLSTPAREYPEFPAAMSFLALLEPDDALRQLELRTQAIEAEIHRRDQLVARAADLPRLFLLEEEYIRALQAAELSWLNGIIDDLKSGRVTWNEAWLRQVAEQFAPDSDDNAS